MAQRGGQAPSLRWLSPAGGVQVHGGADERLEGVFVDLFALLEIDGAARVAFEAGVEEAGRVVEGGALGEGRLHDVLVGLAGADDAVVLPDRDPAPLPCLDNVGVRFVDDGSDTGERLAAPVRRLP